MVGSFHHTTDRDEARELLESTYGPNRIAVTGRRVALDFRLWWNEQRSLRIGYSRYGTAVEIDAPPIESWYVACFPTRGRMEVAGDANAARLDPGRGAVLGPTEQLRFRSLDADCTMLSVQINRGELEDELAAMLGRRPREPIRFARRFDVSAAHDGVLGAAMRLLHGAVSPDADMPDAPANTGPAMMARFDRLLLSGLLLAQPHSYSEALRKPAPPAPPERIRRVLDRIDADPEQPVTVSDLARIACLSVRALEDGFRRHVGTSPMRYLHDVRLTRARALLAEADPGSASVTEIALRCGFLHLGRFAADYRRKYGVSPAQTLRRGPSLSRA